ncbi:MAG: hypothetical protein GY856_21070 [bacterium]|nr:hypothetical protein [bacterium]
MILTIPLHIAVFLGLYLSISRLVEREVISAHARDAETLLQVALSNLRVAMPGDPEGEVHERLWSLIHTHEAMNLHLFDGRGTPVISRQPPDSAAGKSELEEVNELLAARRDRRFWLAGTDGKSLMRGLVRITNGPSCESCHGTEEALGVASMTMDLTEPLDSVRSRLLRYLAAGVVVWTLLAMVVNRMTARAVRRSAASLRAGFQAIETGDSEDSGGKGKASLILDPMSATLFESLSRALRHQREREARFASRMHHADRLASLGSLTAGLAHEIKNPLAGIQGVLEILRDEAPEETTRDLYVQMLDELKRVDSTIRSLLRFARPSPPKLVSTDVPGLLEEMVQLLRPGLQRRSIALELETAPALGQFLLDPEQLRQVLVNLITNAAEALESENGNEDGRIAVMATALPQSRGIIIAVADNGPGIPEEDQKKIFQPFFSSKFSGTGLGLAVTENLVAQHGGRIELESVPELGSTFFVVLPEARAGDESAAKDGEDESAAEKGD